MPVNSYAESVANVPICPIDTLTARVQRSPEVTVLLGKWLKGSLADCINVSFE